MGRQLSYFALGNGSAKAVAKGLAENGGFTRQEGRMIAARMR